MNKICVVTKTKKTYFIDRLIEEVGEVDLFDPWSDLELPVADVYLSRTTGVYQSDLDLLILKSLPQDKVINSVNSMTLFRSKSSQYYKYEENFISCLPWLPLKGMDPVMAEKFSVLYPEVLVKPDKGQGGWGIEVLKRDSLKAWLKKQKRKGDDDYVLQPFIKHAKEFRYFFIKGQSPIVLARESRSGATANFKQSGFAEVSEIPEEHKAEIEKLVNLSGAHYGAIDLLVKDNLMWVLELNIAPGIEQLEKVTGQNIIQSLVKSFL